MTTRRFEQDRFGQIETLFHAVRGAAPERRKALLAQADPELRRQVESLLLQTGTGGPLDRPVPALQDALHDHSESPAAGAQLGPYRIEAKLGEGGMGVVYRAVDTRLGRAVALKTVRDQFNARFQREARAISSLNHPNICILHDIGPNYLVMELVEGETIAARLKRGAIPAQEAITYARQIASALEAAHDKGIIHRDLKPGNVMLAASGAKILDFGLAILEGDETLTGSHMVMGTPAYMPPEQWAGRTTDARTDIYSFGCVFYEMLTAARVTPERQRITARSLEVIVSRCLEGDPARRWQSARELGQRLATVSGTRVGVAKAVARTPSSAPRTLEATRRATIVLGEFENKTGDPVFDGVLRQSLSVQLEQSRFLNLISDHQIQQVLRLMTRGADTRLTPEIAQEICERTGGIAVIEGSVASLGSQFILWLRARSCTGEIIGQEQAQALGKEDVLKTLTRMATGIRKRLEGPRVRSGENTAPLWEATTRSLEALKAYTASRSAVYARGFAAAIPHLQRAISIDPDFALAHADLGFCYWNTGQTDLAQESSVRAWQLRDRVTERERFFILFVYDRQVTGNLQKNLETLESWVQAYPAEWLAWGVLSGWPTRGTGQYERGIRAADEAFRLNPGLVFAFENLASHNTSLGRFSEAASALQNAAERGLENAQLLVARFYIGFLQSDIEAMKREVHRAQGNLESEDWMWHNQALVLARSGRMRSARALWHPTIERAEKSGNRDKAANYCVASAVCEMHAGNPEEAKQRALAALGLVRSREVVYAAAFVFALSGGLAAAEPLAADLARRFPEDTVVQFEYLPTLRALFALSRNTPGEAIELLQAAVPYELAMPGTAFFAKFGGLYPAWVRGHAFIQAGQPGQAAAEFQKVLDHRGIVLADPIGALAHLQLGRALALTGENDRACAAYQEFFTVWKDADADIPVLNQAKAEFAMLP